MSNTPPDIDKDSGFRLPLPARETLDADGQAVWDRATDGQSLAGLRGPAGIKLYAPRAARLTSAVNRYLRYEAGIPARLREIVILATAREMDSAFEWAAHEPEALAVGVPADVIDRIKHRKDTAGLDAADATAIDLVRELWRTHRLSSASFARARDLYGPKQLVELVLLTGSYASTAMLLAALDMQVPSGDAAQLPLP